jgi:glycogen synthase
MTPPGQIRRVLMTTDAVGGVWNYALELCRGLGDREIDVVLATLGPPASPEQRAEVACLGNVTLCESNYRLEWMEAPWEDVARAGEWLLELEWQFAPDIVHLNGSAHGALPWRAPALVVGHSCVLSWWRAVRGEEAPAKWDEYRRTVTAGLQAASLVAAPSRAMLASLRRHYGPLSCTTVIPNGRSAMDYFPGKKEAFVLSVGRLWDEAKNVQALAAVAPSLLWPVRVAGNAAGPDGTVRVLPGIEMLGACASRTMADHYARASIYALPARYEPFGLSVLEAALSGCALVLGDIPSLRELWAGAALFVDPDDRNGLRQTIAELIRRPALREQLGAQARTQALAFTAEQMVNLYLEAYRTLHVVGPAAGRRFGEASENGPAHVSPARRAAHPVARSGAPLSA